MNSLVSQITSLTIVYSIVYSGADQRKHQSSASLAFVRGIHRDRWIPRTKGQLRGKCFHLMTSSWYEYGLVPHAHTCKYYWHIGVETKWTPFCRRPFQMRFLEWKFMKFSITISLKFVPNGPIKNIPALVQIMIWRRLVGAKPLSEPMMVRSPTHICVTRPQWVKHGVETTMRFQVRWLIFNDLEQKEMVLNDWCAILMLWQNMEAPMSILQESPLAGEPRERLFHIHSINHYQLCKKYLYPSMLLWQINGCNI